MIYYSRGGSNNRIYGNAITGSSTHNYFAAVNASATALNQGGGSSIAYSKSNGRLFLVNKNSATAADGCLYYATTSAVPTGSANLTLTKGPSITTSGTGSVFTRMSCITTGGADYLLIAGRNASDTANSLKVVSTLGGTPVATDTAKNLPFVLGDGCDLEYNGADGYLYITQGATSTATGIARIKVPSTPATASSWTDSWTSLQTLRTWTAGSSIAFVDCNPGPQGTAPYFTSGSATSQDITFTAGATRWGTLTYNAIASPPSTTASVAVWGYRISDSTWTPLVNPAAAIQDLSLYSTATYSKLRLILSMSTQNTALTPELDDWTVTQFTPAGGTRPGCKNCHDPHGSDNAEMVAWTPTSGATTSTARQNTVAQGGSNLCYNCHGTGSGTAMDVQAPGSTGSGHALSGAATAHSNEEPSGDLATTRHAQCGDCHNPHANRKGLHTLGTSTAAPALNGVVGMKPSFPTTAAGGWWIDAPTTYAPTMLTANDPTNNIEAYLCFKCHAGKGTSLVSVTTTSGTYIRTDLAQEFNPNNASYHNVTGQSTAMKSSFTVKDKAGATVTQAWPIPTNAWIINGLNSNSKITCTDCHTGGIATQAKGPHGSSAKWMIDPNYATEWSTVTWTNRTASSYICRKCHDMSVSMASGPHGGNHNSSACKTCHIPIPHGWKRPRLIGYTTDPAPYTTTGLSGIKTTWTTHSLSSGAVSWSQSDCYASCSTGNHPSSTSIWP